MACICLSARWGRLAPGHLRQGAIPQWHTQLNQSEHGHGSAAIPVSIGAMLVTLGVVYGDIGTSPMYVTKALLAKAAS